MWVSSCLCVLDSSHSCLMPVTAVVVIFSELLVPLRLLVRSFLFIEDYPYSFVSVLFYSRLLYWVQPIPVATRSKAWVLGYSLARMWTRIPPGAWMFVCCECRVLTGLCVGLMTRLGESHRVSCACVASIMRKPWPRDTVASWVGGDMLG